MSDHNYMISEAYFYQKRNDKATIDMVKGTELELKENATFTIPTKKSIESALTEFNYEFEVTKMGSTRYEYVIKKPSESKFQLEFTCKKNTSELDVIEIIGKSDQDMVIDFFRLLKNDHGRFLYYCTSGLRSVITDSKSNDQIFKEMQIVRI